MSDTFDPIAFLSVVAGDGDWHDEFLAWYQPGRWLSDEEACAAFVADKFAQLQAKSDSHLAEAVNFGIKAIELKEDRDSWYQQHLDRVLDAVKFAAEAGAALAECAALRAIVDKWSTASHLTLHAGEMTAQELRTVQAVVNGIKADIRGAK